MMRHWMRLVEGALDDPRKHQQIMGFIAEVTDFAAEAGLRVRLEPMAMGFGTLITWMERRADARVDVDGFLSQLTGLADQTGMPLQLSIPGQDNEILFRRHGFQTVEKGEELIMQRQPRRQSVTS